MWGGQHKVWIHYRKDIMSADVATGIFLSGYLRHILYTRTYAHHLEVIDLQRYRVIKTFKKVKLALSERTDFPFVFVTGKN